MPLAKTRSAVGRGSRQKGRVCPCSCVMLTLNPTLAARKSGRPPPSNPVNRQGVIYARKIFERAQGGDEGWRKTPCRYDSHDHGRAQGQGYRGARAGEGCVRRGHFGASPEDGEKPERIFRDLRKGGPG